MYKYTIFYNWKNKNRNVEVTLSFLKQMDYN